MVELTGYRSFDMSEFDVYIMSEAQTDAQFDDNYNGLLFDTMVEDRIEIKYVNYDHNDDVSLYAGFGGKGLGSGPIDHLLRP
jgi:hypothetical protein